MLFSFTGCLQEVRSREWGVDQIVILDTDLILDIYVIREKRSDFSTS